ncbi:hypothetical protein STRIP9103_03370 [Streptomyces ipomoeae 91-03]|uniref:Uncharacterized protein n=1 Tax=Streptomyces ipomoeae 91-03 TaxID=698759 RepID=L1L5T4_9ACTN|nr:hypothetical protein STRIP9103_03370 [Streptomyces ipomoeae 91-03]
MSDRRSDGRQEPTPRVLTERHKRSTAWRSCSARGRNDLSDRVVVQGDWRVARRPWGQPL